MGLPFGIFHESGQTLSSWAPQLRFISDRARWLSPEFEWVPYEVTISGGGTMTVAPTDIRGKYLKIGNTAIVAIRAVFTTGGVANAIVNVTLPFSTSLDGDMFVFTGQIADGVNISGYGLPQIGSRILSISRFDGANWGIGASRGARIFGIYETN